MNATRSFTWSAERVLNAGILPLPVLIAAVKSASLIFWTSSEAKSFTFIIFPVAVSPLPSGPWHIAHFALYVASAAASAFAGALRNAMVASATATAMIPAIQLVVFRIFLSFEISTLGQKPCAVVVNL